jgi:hypothetical protein
MKRLDEQSKASVDALLRKRRKGAEGFSSAAPPPEDALLAEAQQGSAAVAAVEFVNELRAEEDVSTAAFLRASASANPNGDEEEDEWGPPVGAYEDAYEDAGADEEEDEDSDEWDEPVGADDHTLALPAFGSMGAGGDIDLLVDAPAAAVDGRTSGPEAGTERRAEEEAPSAEQQAEQRRLKRQHNARRRRKSEVVHRAGLLCWLSHGRLLSDQADDGMVQARLLSLVPPELAAQAERRAATTADLSRMATWLHAYLRAPAPPPAAAVGGRGKGGGRGAGGGGGRGRGGGGRASAAVAASSAASSSSAADMPGPAASAAHLRCEGAWRLVRLVEFVAGSGPRPAWASPAAARAAAARMHQPDASRGVGLGDECEDGRRWLPCPEAGVSPWYHPPAARQPACRAALEALSAALVAKGAAAGDAGGTTAAAPTAAAPTAGATSALVDALIERGGTSAQRALLLLALYRCVGLRARLVLALQPPPLRPPPEGKRHPTPPEPPAGAPHVPLWLEAYLETEERWVCVDPARYGTPIVDQAEATIAARAPSKGAASRAAAARAYVVAFSPSEARDVTPRYVSNVAACHAHRTAADWWEGALRSVPTAGAARLAAGANIAGGAATSTAGPGVLSAVSHSPSSGRAKRPIVLDDDEAADVADGAVAFSSATPDGAAASSSTDGVASSSGASARTAGPTSSSRKRRASAGSSSSAPPPPGAEVVDVEEEDATDRRRAAEDAELRRREAQQPLPTSLAEYKRHPVYVLQRDLKTSQVIHPSDTRPAGLCKGQRVYPRSAVHDVRSEQAWFRRGYDVKPGEHPAKELAPKAAGSGKKAAAAAAAAEGEATLDSLERLEGGGGMGADGSGGAGGAAGSSSGSGGGTPLFGDWQVIEHVPLMACDGKVPRSSHGHVELWTARHLPIGCVHISAAQAGKLGQAAKQLGLDAAPAMVGFDVHDGRPVPKFDGFVVCEEHADLLREAASEMNDLAENGEAQKRHDQALALWGTLLRALAVRRRLEQQYGNGDRLD